ncbi:MAG: PIN domain-containing protein [Candidatus Nanohaloarchaea archaeon]
MIADTSFIIDLLKKDEDAIKKAEKLEKQNKAHALGSPTIYELWISMARSNKKEEEEIKQILGSQPVHELREESAKRAVEIQEKLIEKGGRVGHLDALIAGIALENGEKIITGNIEEFERIEGLEAEGY